MLDYAAIAEAQRDCPSIQAAGDSSLTLQLVPFGTVWVLCNTILLGNHHQVFDAFHSMAHPGAKATRRIMNQRVVWSCMSKGVTKWVKDCQACSRAKVTSQPAAAVQSIPAPTEPPAALASADLVYVRKGGQLQPLVQPYSGPYKAAYSPYKAAYRNRRDHPSSTALTWPPARGAASFTSHSSDTSDASGSDYSGPGTITRPSSYYRSSPCAPT